jgi:glycosyltransferase involved in cell wall biosynthesis
MTTMPKRKLAVITSHPIQYYAPVFRALAKSESLDVQVFYTWSQAADTKLFDRGFGTAVTWDIPLLTGYAHRFVANVSAKPGTDHFGGLKNPSLIPEIETWGAEAVLIYGWYAQSHLRALRYFKNRIPVLFRGDSTLLDPSAWWRTRLRRIFLHWVYSHVDVALAVGTNSRDYFAWCGLKPQAIAIAPHSVDTLRFYADTEAQERSAAQWRQDHGIGPDAVVILYAGKLQAKKDPELLLRASELLSAETHWVFVGSGELESTLSEITKNRRNVHFLPFQNQSQMPMVYRIGDLYALPSRGPGETWGLALNEAMACGRAILASSKVGGARDLIEPNVNGWVFDAGNLSSLLSVLRPALARGRSGLLTMGQEGLSRSQRWSTETSARCIEEAVITALSES